MIIEPHGTSSAKINKIHDTGMIADWNMRNTNQEDLVKEGDIIVAVNGIHGSLELFKDEMKKESVTLSLIHCVLTEPTSAEVEEAPAKDANEGAANLAKEQIVEAKVEPALEKKSGAPEFEDDCCDVDLEPFSAPEAEHKACCVLFAT